ncbi:MAG: TIGR03085 family protein [Propionibacteriales bacterium]|nr:TIGR03085 family protein [Propionibacteriales bacterium]
MTDLSTAYTAAADAPTGPNVSRVERAQLCDLLDRVGPSAPTLCEGWDTHHLVAHLRGREGSPLRQAVSAIPRLGDRSVHDIVAHHAFSSLVDDVRHGPPRVSVYGLPRLEPILNVIEFFVHHEDVRRAADGWEARDLPRWAENQIWVRIVGLAKLTQRRKPTGLVLERSDATTRARVSNGDDDVVIAGRPSELALHLSGRVAVARVELVGSPDTVAAYTQTLPGS